MSVVELLLRATAALVLGDPAAGPAPLLALATLELTAVAVAVLVARLLAVLLGVDAVRARRTGPPLAADLPTRIAWSCPDADGHVRSRAPGAGTRA